MTDRRSGLDQVAGTQFIHSTRGPELPIAEHVAYPDIKRAITDAGKEELWPRLPVVLKVSRTGFCSRRVDGGSCMKGFAPGVVVVDLRSPAYPNVTAVEARRAQAAWPVADEEHPVAVS